jgi:antirestriction protein ArdC
LGDTPRITEIGLYDNTGTLIAIGKLNKTYYKPVDDLVAFAITIEY